MLTSFAGSPAAAKEGSSDDDRPGHNAWYRAPGGPGEVPRGSDGGGAPNKDLPAVTFYDAGFMSAGVTHIAPPNWGNRVVRPTIAAVLIRSARDDAAPPVANTRRSGLRQCPGAISVHPETKAIVPRAVVNRAYHKHRPEHRSSVGQERPVEAMTFSQPDAWT